MLPRMLVLAALAPCALAQAWFQAPMLLDAANGDVRAVADLDGDGDQDLLRVVGTGLTWVSMTPWWNQGGGTFTPGTPQTIAANAGPPLLIDDFDGDQRPDLIWSALQGHAAGPGLVFHHGLPGGVFAAPLHVPLAGNVRQLLLGRGNGDALPDAAVVGWDSAAQAYVVQWALGRANLPPAAQPSAALGAGFYVEGFARLDADGDGDHDLAVSGNGVVDFFTTQAGALANTSTLPLPSSSGWGSLLGIDVDRDLDDDLLAFTTNLHDLTITRFVNPGNGAFAAIAQILPNTPFGALHAGDWDGDGDPDLMLRSGSGTANNGRLGLHANDGSGVFALAWSRSYALPDGYGEVGCVHLDGDGKLDFADTKALVFGNGSLAELQGPTQLSIHPPQDWEDDGDIDVPREGGELSRNDGRGVFTTEQIVVPAGPGPNLLFGSAPLLADFDGDGLREALVALTLRINTFPQQFVFQRMHRLEDTGTGQFVDLGPASALGGVPMRVAAFAADTNGDNVLDVVDRNGVWANNGSHSFVLQPQSFQQYEPFAAGDVEGDGDIDFLAGFLGGTQRLAVLRQTGPHTFTIDVIYPSANGYLPYHAPCFADLDGDGDLDVVVDRSIASGEFELWLNQGPGLWTAGPTFSWPGLQGTTAAAAGDFDGDGATDLLFSLVGNTLRVLRRNGPGLTYDPPRDFAAFSARHLFDADGDGDLDLIGGSTVWNRRFAPPANGERRQFGVAAAGAGGVRPVLGCAGVIRGGHTPVLRLREAVGGTFTLLGMGMQETNLPSPVLPGLVGYTYPFVVVIGFAVPGAPGVPRAGALDVPIAIPPGFGAATLFFQHFVLDAAAANGVAHTNGLEFRIGS